ncbi:MAG: hypothetical protein GC186_11565 [Rhodobacteraceae bacterium]|nr:hypothetical protein [Paracoccaceae bacterium]
MANIRSLAQLRALLLDMESELGLIDLTPVEKDVFYAISEVTIGEPPVARSEAIRSHPLTVTIPQATFHRAIRSLVDRGYIQHAPDSRAGLYIIPVATASG